MGGKKFKTGDIVKIDTVGILCYTESGFATSGYGLNDDEIILYETIDIESFPSFNDFKGKQTLIKHDTCVIILEHIGRPFKISKDPKWFAYEIYKILCPGGNICHVFRQNLKEIKREKPVGTKSLH